ncbi:MAG: hypothetical protein ACT4QD_27015, partial [Acidobacteriota bacterium]
MKPIRLALLLTAASTLTLSAQRPFTGQMDETRARQLYVSDKHDDHSRPDFQRQIDEKAKEDARYAALCKGLLECTKVTYRSSVGDMDIPAYLFQPLTRRGARGHAAMIWVHGGVHGNWSLAPY